MARLLFVTAVLGGAAALASTALAAPGPWTPLATTGPQYVTIHIRPAVNGREVMDDANIAVVPDVPVRLVVVNTSRELHTFTIAALHVSVLVRQGTPGHPSRTLVAFTAPSTGTFTWYCEFCPAVHHQSGMHGRVYALVGG